MKISPSLMCADQMEMMRHIVSLIKLGVDQFHFDIMDGNFVGNLALNLNIIKKARELTRTPFDVHLMVQNPSTYFDQLIEYGADYIIFHLETKEDIQKNIDYLKSKNVHVGLALHLDTPVSAVEKYLNHIDRILFMNVQTGYSGLSFDPKVYEKINTLYSYIKKKNLNIEIMSDGGIKLEHVKPLYENGTDTIVAGTSMLFNANGFSNNLQSFKTIRAQLPIRKECDLPLYTPETLYKAAVLKEVNKFEVQQKPLRPLQDHEALIKVMSCGVCGSDLVRVYKKGMYSPNLVPGHEFSGTVVKTNDANGSLLDKRVAVFPLIPCKTCEHCKSQKQNLCENYNYLGSRTDGAFAQYVIAPKENLIFLPDTVSYDEAALIEPMAVALRGLKKLSDLTHSNVIILGLGPIGLLAGMLAKKMGAHTVTGIDRYEFKQKIAKESGFTTTYGPTDTPPEKSFNVLIECSGSSKLLDNSIQLLQKESRILLLGNHEQDFVLSPKTISTLLRGEIRIYTSWNSLTVDPGNNDWKICADYIAKKELNIAPLITHKYPLSDIKQVFDKIINKDIRSLKVVINPNS